MTLISLMFKIKNHSNYFFKPQMISLFILSLIVVVNAQCGIHISDVCVDVSECRWSTILECCVPKTNNTLSPTFSPSVIPSINPTELSPTGTPTESPSGNPTGTPSTFSRDANIEDEQKSWWIIVVSISVALILFTLGICLYMRKRTKQTPNDG